MKALFLLILLSAGFSARAESESSQQIADRYEQMLLRSPQPGTPFDRVIEWYSSNGGGLEALQARWEKAATENVQHLILQGLLAERLRTPDKARKFYLQAMEKAGDSAAAARLLATLETSEGHFPAAAEAYKNALGKDSLPAVDRMEMMRALALLYRRSFDDKKAGEVWQDALVRFPNDPYVLEEAGEAFLDAGNYEAARTAFARLQEVSQKDPFRKVAASLRLARTAELDGKTDEAVKIYELTLEETSAGSWINREVRSRIEELFRRKDDLPGLLAYYERRTAAVPQDYFALAAQATVLEDLGRGTESLARLRSATKLAPADVTLRLKLVRQLDALGSLQEAIAEARELAKPAEAAPETFIALGQLLWSDHKKNASPTARAEAIATWKRLAPPDSQDASRIAQLAEIFLSKGENDAAVEEWKRLIALSPAAADARQKLAQIFLQRGDKPAAIAILAGLVAGDLAKPENFLTLARIQAKLEWPGEARSTIRAALAAFPADAEILSAAWRQAMEANDRTEAAALLPAIWKSAPNDFFASDAIRRYVAFLEAAGADKEAMDALASKPEPDELDATLLFQLAISRRDEEAAKKAIPLLRAKTTPVRIARADSDFAQAFGSPDEQIAALKAVAMADPRLAAESLKSAVKILAESGKTDEALATILQLIERSPADGSLYGLYADIAIRSGRLDVATARLQEGVRYAEDPGALRLQLATFLQAQSRNAEASKVLQEAFEAEEREGRRTEIFRRQIELAMMTGTEDALIASLREKQSREQGGARYGTYLAEIFLMQGDFLTAREELAKSLGHNPNSPQAVAKLLDLADRGGDQEEGLRLAARLAEIEPSRENRANHIARLFNSGESAKGMEELDKARAEILKDPADWSSALAACRKAGFTKESDALVEEIASTKATGVLMLTELAKLRLSQLDIAAAEKILWQILETENFGEAVEALTQASPAAQPNFPSPAWARFQPLQQLSSEVQSSLQALFQPGQRGFFPRSFQMGLATAQQTSAEQRAVVRALLLLHHLSLAQGQEKEFARKAVGFLEKQTLSPTARFLVLTTINSQDALKDLIAREASADRPDLALDKILIGAPFPEGQTPSPDLEKIKERLEKADPEFAFQQEISKLHAGSANHSPAEGDPKKARLAKIRTLLEHPGAKTNPSSRLHLASLAAASDDLELATEICESVKNSEAPVNPLLDQQLDQMAMQLVAAGILKNDARAEAAFEKVLAGASSTARPTGGMFFPGMFYSGMGRGANVPLLNSKELATGDSEFPITLFRRLFQSPFPSADGEKIAAWFAERTKPGQLDSYSLGLAYCEWFSGKKEEALKRMEAIHAASPTPRSAALLLECYEKLKAYEKALAVLDLAALQKSESPDIRTVRKIRLLRAAGKAAEAKDLAEKLVRGRVSSDVRDVLRNELSQLGIPANKYPALANNRFSRSSNDRSNQLRIQISKLVADQKQDEAERMAVTALQNPLPSTDDYQATNVRRVMLDALRSMKRLDKLQAALEARLSADPGDFDAAVRLLEIETMSGEQKPSLVNLPEIIAAHPDRAGNIAYALQLLQQRPDTKGTAGKILCGLIRSNLLQKSGFPIERINDIVSDPKIGLELAELVAAMDEASFSRFFLPSRLSGRMSEAPFLSQLAEVCVAAGKKETAISLLKRAKAGASSNLDGTLPAVMRLAELQLLSGDKEAAAATMKDLFEPTATNRYARMFGGNQDMSNVLMNMLMSRMPGQAGADQLARLSKIATETGTLDLLLTALDKQSDKSQGITPSLLLKTSLGRPGIAEEWRKIALDTSVPLGFLNLQTLSPVFKVLASEKDAAKLIPALLGRISTQQTGMGGDAGLVSLSETLPVLAKFGKDPAVKKHIEFLISSSMRDPNAAQYLTHSASYPSALSALIDAGYFQEARALLDFTKPSRSSRQYGRESLFASFEARLDAAEGLKTNFQIVCAPGTSQEGKTQIHWKVSAPAYVNPNDGNRGGATWDNSTLPVPEKQRPVSLEILAGRNPACLALVAKSAKPGLEGTLAATLPGNYGLLQARWTLPDGSRKSGSLTSYVQGENLIPHAGIPAEDAAGFQPGQPGPFGEKSGVAFSASLPHPEHKIPLGEITLDNAPQILVMTGWLQASQSNGQIPQIEIETIRDNGSKNQANVYLPQAAPGQWRQFINFLAYDTQLAEANSLDKESRKTFFSLSLRASTGSNSQWQISGAWDGLGLFRFPPEADTESADKIRDRARKSASDENYAATAADWLTALRLNPRRVLQDSSSDLFRTFEKAGKLSDLYAVLSEPALYLPDPLNDNSPTVHNDELISLLARGAISDTAPAEAKAWLREVGSAPLSENMRFLVESATLREEAKQDASQATAEKVLDVLGFRKDALNQERIRQLWSRTNPSAFELLSLLESPEKVAEARDRLSKSAIPTPLLAAQKTIEAWLLAPSDPSVALKLWTESVGLRSSGENSVSFNSDSDKSLILRIAMAHESPGDIVAAIKSWSAGNRGNPDYAQRPIVETLYSLSSRNSKSQAFYATAWADAELAALRLPNYSANHERVRELAHRMLQAAEWDRLASLLALAETNPSLNSQDIRRDFAQLRDFVAFAKGDSQKSFQIACAAGRSPDGKMQVHWKISLPAYLDPNESSHSGALWDTSTLPVPENQRPASIEIFAGPNPACLAQVAKSAELGLEGTFALTLPGNYGLIQARWTLPDGSRKSGSLTAYVQGENLIASSGVPTGDAAGFLPGQPGPLGDKSAVSFSAPLPGSQHKIPLGEIPLDSSPQILVLIGWLQASPSNGQTPRVEMETLRNSGSKNREAIHLSRTPPGQWRQFVKFLTFKTQLPESNSLDKDTRKMLCFLSLQSNYGGNSQRQISGAWDGLGVFRFPPEEAKESADTILSRARKSASANDYAAAAADWLTALRLHPRRTLEQRASDLFQAFEKAGKLSELYTFLSDPALYLPDPLSSNSPTVRNEGLVALLARGATSETAPAEAKAWLQQVSSAPLSENMRFMLESATLREKVRQDTSQASAETVLDVLGFRKNGQNPERIGQLWSRSTAPTFELLSLLETPESVAEARALLAKSKVPPRFIAGQKIIEAWLLAPSDPSAALALWAESTKLRSSGETSISFNTDSDKAMILRIAKAHESPGDVIAALKSWAAGNRSNQEYAQRQIVEVLEALASLDAKTKDIYSTAWADAEMAAARLPNYKANDKRVRDIARRLLEAGEWDRLASLVAYAEANKVFSQQDIAKLRDLVAFAKGDCSKAWPVTWCAPGTNSRKTTIRWQWNTKDIQPLAGKFDTAISVASKPLLAEIPSQTGIEFLFGDIPANLAVIAKADGPSATGSLDVELPADNGFLRAVAIVDGKRIPGPLVPVLSGKRLFPDVPLKDFLQTGPRPITASLLSDSGTAPDGSPAVKIGLPGSNDRWGFDGLEIPVEPGRFYAMRGWVRRAGEGTASLSAEFRAVKTSKAGALNMILSERDEATSQWVLYTRALPVIPQHTFWIPFREVSCIAPRIWDLASGTEIAGWELLEIDGWKYGKWLEEIAMLRESAGEVPEPALLDKMLELAAVEPLTAIDYHGDWLVAQLVKAGHTEKLIPLYRAALAAEANPFYSRPKLWRIFGSLLSLADKPDAPEAVRWEAQELALANQDRLDNVKLLIALRCQYLLAKDRGLGAQTLESITTNLFGRIADKNKGSNFLAAILMNRSYRDDRPTNEFLALMNALADKATIQKFLDVLDGDDGKSLTAGKREFIRLALELCLPPAKTGPEWSGRLSKAFQSMGKSKSPADYMFWPSLLGELMLSKKCASADILELRQKALEYLLGKGEEPSRQDEIFRATAALAEYCAATSNPAPIKEWFPKALEALASSKPPIEQSSLRMALRTLEALTAMKEKESADALLKLVEADVRKSPKILETYSKYLPADLPPASQKN